MSDTQNNSYEQVELQEWRQAFLDMLKLSGEEQAENILDELFDLAHIEGIEAQESITTPYVNTIPPEEEPQYPGKREVERRIKSIVRWNAMVMVTGGNMRLDGIGGHISTYASAATLYEIGFNHFWRAPSDDHPGDFVYFQGHASPGVYARAYVEGRLSDEQLKNFRRELAEGGGLSSYPHPWLMPNFWQFPTVSMGIGPLNAIYHARFIKYLENRGLKDPSDQKVWAFLGDGETDEPESLGCIGLAGREHLDNLIFVVNCNLQRLDGPVRGNGNIVQELEGRFRGAGWNVIKVLWGSGWDELFEVDTKGLIVKRLSEVVDGEYQKYSTADGQYIRENFFGKSPELLKLVEKYSNDELEALLKRGGHDPRKVYAAYKRATEITGKPTVILAKTVKGYGLGEAGEGKNIAHNQKKLNVDEMIEFRTRFGIPLADDDIHDAAFYRPLEDSIEYKYLHERRAALGGYVPQRNTDVTPIELPDEKHFEEFEKGSGESAISTTAAFVRIMGKLLRDKNIGKLIVPIVPDESRTFGMEGLFRQVGIYSHQGQLYEPVDAKSLMYYKESQNGQILQEGINEAGSMGSFTAAGTAYSNHGINTIPFYIFYSMFGFQRIGDFAWAAGDSRCKGFMIGGTAGRTTLNGEGLQHEDGHSHAIAGTIPNCVSYDPAYAFELSAIIKYGIKRMYYDHDDVFFYVTTMNENYVQPPKPEHVKEEDIIKGLYLLYPAKKKAQVNLLGSGTILNEVVKAKEILESDYGLDVAVWSVTSYNEIYRDALSCDRHNLLNPGATPKTSYLEEVFKNEQDSVFVSSSDYIKALGHQIDRWIPAPHIALGTDGFGRSESREALRDFFEVDAKFITLSALTLLADKGSFKKEKLAEVIKKLGINPDKLNPMIS